MESRYTIAGAPEVNLAVRVRGLSHEERYFDEQGSATRLTRDFIVIRLSKRVDLEIEVHVVNMQTQIGGIYRVAWINILPEQGWHSVGLELLDPEGEIWEPNSIYDGLGTADAAPAVLLECQRCYQRVHTTVPEAEPTSLREGFTIARPCDTCKATTGWGYVVEKPVAGEALAAAETAPADGSADQSAESPKDKRQKGRAPIQLKIKIIRTRYGMPTVDICETINVSRTGVYFKTEQKYELGETLDVVLPYDPDSVAIPVMARVVRQDERRGTYAKYVAVQLSSGATTKP
jgi:hypothetical protein